MQDTPLPEIFDARDEPAAAGEPAIQPPTAPTAVAKVDLLALALSRFGEWRAGAAALVERYRAVAFDLSTTAGYAELTKAIAEVRAPRYAAQNMSEASKRELASVSKAVGAEKNAVTAHLADTEMRLVKMRDDHDEKVESDKAEAGRLEKERIAKHQAGIATIRSYLGNCQGLPAARIALCIEQLQHHLYGDDWQEFAIPAAIEQRATLQAMRMLHAQTVRREAESARREADRQAEADRLEAQRVDQERVAAEQAEAARQLAEQRAELSMQHKTVLANMARVACLRGRIAEIRAAATGHERSTAADLAEAITAVAALDVSEDQFQEFYIIAGLARDQTLAALQVAHGDAIKRAEADVAALDDGRLVRFDSSMRPMPMGQPEWERSTAAHPAPLASLQLALPLPHLDPRLAPLAQDLHAGLSGALAADPAAPLHVREAAAAIGIVGDPAQYPPMSPMTPTSATPGGDRGPSLGAGRPSFDYAAHEPVAVAAATDKESLTTAPPRSDESAGLDNDNLLLRLSLLAALMGDSRPRATLRDAITRIEHLTTEVAALRAELAVLKVLLAN